MAIVRWEPRNRLFGYHRHHDFDRFFNSFLSGENADEERAWLPRVDIDEGGNEIVLRADLPGIDEKDIKVTLEDDVLTLRGERVDQEKQEGRDYHRLERRFGTFQRSFTLGVAVDAKKISADYKNGVLTVKLPKTEESKPKEIEIKVN
jgi:HSP20 family protein